MQGLTEGQIISRLEEGAVGVMPTDTVYGLVCSAANKQAARRLYALKRRERKPGTVIAADIGQLVKLGIPRRYLKAVEQFWPNPISVIIPCGDELEYLHAGLKGLAVRIPKDEVVHKLLIKTGPLLTSSANQPGKKPASTLQEARNYFGNAIDFYMDGGDLSERGPSTIIRIIDDAIEVVREGAVKIDKGRKDG